MDRGGGGGGQVSSRSWDPGEVPFGTAGCHRSQTSYPCSSDESMWGPSSAPDVASVSGRIGCFSRQLTTLLSPRPIQRSLRKWHQGRAVPHAGSCTGTTEDNRWLQQATAVEVSKRTHPNLQVRVTSELQVVKCTSLMHERSGGGRGDGAHFPVAFSQMKMLPQSDPLTTYSSEAPRKLTPCCTQR